MYKIRELQREDLQIINKWRNDSDLIANLGAPFRYINSDVENRWYENYLNNRNTSVRCAILKQDEIIGLVSLVSIDQLNQSGELHIMIGNRMWQNQGAGTFGLTEMIKHAFYNLNLRRLELSVLETNERACHLYEKLGFVYEGLKRQAKYKNGSFVNVRFYGLLKEDFNNKQQS